MKGEETTDVPDAWRSVVHPRRHGRIGLEPVLDLSGNLAGFAGKGAAWGGELTAEHERVLAHSPLDPALVALARSGQPSVVADAIRLALTTGRGSENASGNWPVAPVDELAAARGLAHAAAAFVESCTYYLDYESYDSRVLVLLRHLAVDESGTLWSSAARHLRSMLAVAPQEVYDEAQGQAGDRRPGRTARRSNDRAASMGSR
jgi:hypothetical protein